MMSENFRKLFRCFLTHVEVIPSKWRYVLKIFPQYKYEIIWGDYMQCMSFSFEDPQNSI